MEKVQATGEIDLRWKNKVVGLRHEKETVVLRVETPDGVYEAKASYVIAADGGHSAMRDLAGAEDAKR